MTTLAARFWPKVDTSAGLFGCWPWLGAMGNGYGQIVDEGLRRRATHVSLELAGRPLGPGMQACHTCDNPPCVNPAHLFEGTQKDNIADQIAKGRARHGARNYNARPRELCEAIRNSTGTGRQAAAQFGVSQNTVAAIRRGDHWSVREAAPR